MVDRQSSLNALADTLEESLSHDDMKQLLTVIKTLPNDLHIDALDVSTLLYHYIGDGKKRKRDQELKEQQETQMRHLIDALRAGRSRDELLDYTF